MENFSQTASKVLQTSLDIAKQWCDKPNVSITTNKTVIIYFTREREVRGLKESTLFSKTIQLFHRTKHFGLTLDKWLILKSNTKLLDM
jgi:hypothetical protein